MDFTSSRSDRTEGAAFGPPPQAHLGGPQGYLDSQSGLTYDSGQPSSELSAPHGLLRLREGTQLLGLYEGSAYKQPTYLVRRDDGQVIHLSHLLYLVAVLIDGERNLTEIAEALSKQLGRHVVKENVEHLVEKKLRPSGLIAGADADDQAKALTRSLPLLALRYRKRVIPARLHRGITTVLLPAFWPPVVLLVLGAFVALNIWLFDSQRAALTRAVRQLPFHPNLFLLVTFLVIFSGFFHELGHATATRYGGGSPGVMGVGIYLAWPAFYTDLTDSYRLNRAGRLRADLGGVYFNAVLVVLAGAGYLWTGFGPLAVFMVVSQAMAIYQFLPFVRLDGYYIMSDLVGVPNLFAYLGPVLRSTFHRSDPATDAQLHLLKRRARVAIKIWTVVTVLFLTVNFGGLALLAPIILSAELVAIHLQGQAMVMAFATGNVAVGINDLVDLVVVAIAPVGLLLIAGILLRRALRAIKKGWPTHPKVTAALAALLTGLLLFQGQGLVSRFAAFPGSSGSKATATEGGKPTPPVVGLAPHPVVVRPAPSSSNAPLVSSMSAPSSFYVVQAGDTLWTIAARTLADPEGWQAMFDLNVGRPQPGGGTLVDPDLIYPGWRLELPDSQTVAAFITQASPPAGQADDALAARPSTPLPQRTGFDTGDADAVPRATHPPTGSDSVNQPDQLVSERAPSPADGTIPGGASRGETISGAVMTRVQLQKPTTIDGPTATNGRCALSPQACRSAQDSTGQPGAPPPEFTSQLTPPPSIPVLSPQDGITQRQRPEDGPGREDVTNGQVPMCGASQRSPPNPTGRCPMISAGSDQLLAAG